MSGQISLSAKVSPTSWGLRQCVLTGKPRFSNNPSRGTEGENRGWDLLLSVYSFQAKACKNNNRQDPALRSHARSCWKNGEERARRPFGNGGASGFPSTVRHPGMPHSSSFPTTSRLGRRRSGGATPGRVTLERPGIPALAAPGGAGGARSLCAAAAQVGLGITRGEFGSV